MNRRKLFSISIVFTVIAALMIFMHCEFKNPTEDFKLIANVAPVKTTVQVNLNDIGMGGVVTQSVEITVEGPLKNEVVDLGYEYIDKVTTTDGIAQFGFTDNVAPTPDNPESFVIVAKSNGYITTSIKVTMDTLGEHFVDIEMVSLSNLPDGASAVQTGAGAADGSGATLSPVQISTPITGASNTKVTVEIPQGTVIKDAAGRPLTGSLSTQIAFFSGESDEATANMPGGYNVQFSADANGLPGTGTFYTAGFFSMELKDAGGREGETFSQPIKMTVDVSPDIVNPDTEQPIQAGETIDIWSYNEMTGEWKYEHTGIFTGPDANGNYQVEVTMTHLSWWNLDYKKNKCDDGIWVDILGRSPCDPCLFFGLEITQGTRIVRRKVGIICDNIIKFRNAPQGKGANLVAYKTIWDWYYKRNEIGRTTIANLCDQVPNPNSATAKRTAITVTLPGTGFHKTFKFVGVCPNRDDVEVRPSLFLHISESDPPRYRYLGKINNGEITVCNLAVPKTYWLMTWYRGEKYEAKVTINADYTLNLDYSDSMTITQSGDVVTYTVNLPEDTCKDL